MSCRLSPSRRSMSFTPWALRPVSRIWLRAHCDFLTERARFGYSTDGKTFTPLGGEFVTIFQLKTFQGVRYSLFHYNDRGAPGGWADFDDFTVAEPHPRGRMQPIPIGRTVSLQAFDGWIVTRGTTSRSRSWAMVLGRPWVST